MQIERFLSILIELRDELAKDVLSTALTQLITILPTASKQKDFEEVLSSLSKSMAVSRTNSYPLSKSKALAKINGTKFFGNEARKAVESILHSPDTYNPADKVAALTAYQSELTEFKSKIANEILSLEKLGISPHRLVDEKFEVGVILSEYVTGNELKKIQEYLGEWHLLLKYLNEITKGDHVNPKISALGSSESLEVYFDNSKETAKSIATAVDQIVAIYNKVLDGRSKLEALKQDGYIDIDIDKNYEENKTKMISSGLQKIVDEIAAEYGNSHDSGRLNELKIGLRKSFEFIANSIDKGIDVEVNTPDPPDPEPATTTTQTTESASNSAEREKIQKLQTDIQFIREAGSKSKLLPGNRKERILGLPEPDLKDLGQQLSKSKESKK